MGKVSAYLKTFFLLDPPESYEVAAYKDYTGPGFARYKTSQYFRQPRRLQSGYLKSEVAAYSEMTKIAILVGMTIFISIAIWADVKVISLFANAEFRKWEVVALVVPIAAIFNWSVIGFYPRAIFVFKNFKAPIK